ncbi:translation initiation factor IF-2 N-terminal domain-containing protein [Nostoc sp.]|uniref:translation initiation factor IF-2 N-terminal domain-containing protein n=1 Tax=Nostoc sp. TaxID=1180 RepID=UPI002FF9240C
MLRFSTSLISREFYYWWAILPKIRKATKVEDVVPCQHLGILDLENFVGKGKRCMNNAQVRIYELSKELNLDNKELLAICDQLNIVVKSYSSKISEFDAGRIRLAAKKYASKNGIQQELAITSDQPTSPKTISPNRLAPIHK